jgi:hypothetical protein
MVGSFLYRMARICGEKFEIAFSGCDTFVAVVARVSAARISCAWLIGYEVTMELSNLVVGVKKQQAPMRRKEEEASSRDSPYKIQAIEHQLRNIQAI